MVPAAVDSDGGAEVRRFEATGGPRRGSRSGWIVAGFAVVIAAVAVAGAGFVVLRPAEDPLTATAYTTVPVEQGQVGSSLRLNTVAVWEPTPVGVNRVSGVVTGVEVAAGDEVGAGDTVYTVNLRPVVVAAGAVPAFRAISRGDQGTDVAQLQLLLAQLGHYAGPADGTVGWGTVTAIRAWQKASGVAQTGVVEWGDVVFVPSLPTRVSLDPAVVGVGKTLTGGEEVVRGLPASPVFTIPMTDAQASMVPIGTHVRVTAPDGSEWSAVAADKTSDSETQTVTVGLTGIDGGAVCGEACGSIPVTAEVRLSSEIETVPTVEGLVVPSAALVTDASGQVSVVDEDGARRAVTVRASARGMSVIDGVDEGLRVRVPAGNGAPG
ncbi:peptidoglycan-binding protein [Microbacterium hominis]|uniref:Peptidoglycan-binding protein n=2 Tax=Microbacterium hominis TaxID=162426 RepID=A0A7D4Q398_9MICO|nr:peptidoglycan-binding protein [Microbacterium hominis]